MMTNPPFAIGRKSRRPLVFARVAPLLALASCLALCLASAQNAYPPPVPPGPSPQPPSSPGAPQPQPQPPCGNNDPACPCHDCETPNPVDVVRSDVMRDVRDLEVFGGVGEHQLHWTRYGHSRSPGGGGWFGDGHTWRHSYQWEMASTSSVGLQIIHPDGTVRNYTKNGTLWSGLASDPDLLTQSGSTYSLQTAEGFTYRFAQLTSGAQTFYQLQSFTDSNGLAYYLTYDASNRLVLVSEPAGRWLRITYQSISVNQNQFTNLGSLGSTPASGVWTTLNVNDATAYRYLRYYASDPDSFDAFCNVAEIQFLDKTGAAIAGTPFGSVPAWNNTSSTFDKAFDGDPNTFFDYASAHFGFTGIDLGAGNAKAVGQIRFFPRLGYEVRMSSGRFEGSNVAPVTETVIAKVEAGAGSTVTRTVQYDYATFADPVLTNSAWLTLTGANYGDTAKALYVYQSVYAGQHPVLFSANDPRISGDAATRIVYEFWRTDAYILGAIFAERDYQSNQVLVMFQGEGNTGFSGPGRKVTYANGGAKHVVTGGDHNTTSRADELGNTTSYTYAPNNGFRLSQTDALNHTTSYTRDTQGRLLSIKYPDNSTESWTRDSLGHILTHTDERGYTTTWTRSGSGRATRIDYPDGGYETFTYNGFGQVLTHRQTNGGTESFAYDTRGLKTSWTDALNHTTTYAYDANDLLASATDPLNHTTTYAHNERGQVTQVTYADNTSTSYGYDAYGNRLSTTNELGKTWSSAYDAYKRKITATDPLNRTTQYWYDEPGSGSSGCGGCGSGLGGTGNHLTTVILPSGKTTKINYDLAWRKTGQTVGYNTTAAATTGYGYDVANNVTCVTDGRGKATTYTYDSRNRSLSATDPLNHPTSWTYDQAGNQLTEKRADNGVISYQYDAMNRRTKVTDPLSQVTQMSYDAAGNLTTLTDARSNAYGYLYDLRNRKTRMTYPDTSHEDWSYDAAGNRATYVTRAGQTETFTYDARSRETLADWSDATPDISHTYDAAGRMLTLNNAISALTYTYDQANQMLTEKQDIADGPGPQTLAYTYDADGNQAGLTYPDSLALTYAYTARNQMSSVTAGSPPPLATYTYDLAGNRLTKTLENGTSVNYTYDDANRLTGIVNQAAGSTFASLAYTYNTVNNRTSVTRETGSGDAYGYDATDQLTGVQYDATNPATSPTSPAKTQGFVYDVTGNRTSASENGSATSYTANNLNEYTMVGSVSPTYDVNGNLLTGAAAGITYTYDAMNRLTGAQIGTGSGSSTTSFDYDGRSRCVRRTTMSLAQGTSQRLCLIYDGWSLIEEQSRSYTAGSTYSEQARYINGATIDEVLSKTDANGTEYYHHDALNSTTHLTNSSGVVLEKYRYDVFGAPFVYNASGSQLSGGTAYGNRFLFTGREWLASVAVYDYRNRMHSASTGRFLQVDVLRFGAQDVNLLRYVRNNPATFTDPLGLEPYDGGQNPGNANGNLYGSYAECVAKNTAANLLLTAAGIVFKDVIMSALPGITMEQFMSMTAEQLLEAWSTKVVGQITLDALKKTLDKEKKALEKEKDKAKKDAEETCCRMGNLKANGVPVLIWQDFPPSN